MLEDLNQKTLSESVKHGGAAFLGATASGAVAAFVPKKQKKIFRIGAIVVAIAAGAAHQGKSAKMKTTTSLLGGVAIRQGMDLLKESLKDKYTITDASTDTDKAIAGAIGLACPGGCSAGYQYPMNNTSFPQLSMPSYDTSYEVIDQPAQDISVAFT